MASRADGFLSIRITRFYMKVIGFWYAENKRDQWILNAVLSYTVVAVTFGITVEIVDLFHCVDFEEVTWNMSVTMPLIVIAMKVIICIFRRKTLLDLIRFTEKNFWNAPYDEYGIKILKECERKGIALVCILSFAVQGTVGSYVVVPLFGNIGKNETERNLPFRFWSDLPTQMTPYFEIIFTIQTLSAIHSGICFFCFDNLMGIFNIYLVGQFRILQHRIENVCEEYVNNVCNETQFSSYFYGGMQDPARESSNLELTSEMEKDTLICQSKEKLLEIGEKCHAELKECVKQHLLLIDYVNKLESGFNLMVFFQMGSSSFLICLAGFQFFVAKHGIFVLHLTSAFSQMLLFTWTCNEIIIHSMQVGDAAFRSRWYMLPCTGSGLSIRRGLMLIMIRARRACYVSAGKFAPMSLKSFTNIMSTTMSYLSLLRQISEEV